MAKSGVTTSPAAIPQVVVTQKCAPLVSVVHIIVESNIVLSSIFICEKDVVDHVSKIFDE